MLSVTALTSLDPVLRDLTAFGVLTEVDEAALISYDVIGPAGSRAVRRRLSHPGGLLEDVVLALDHPCLSCAVREDLLPLLIELGVSGLWSQVVVALPPAAEPLPLARALHVGQVGGRPVRQVAKLAGVVAVLDGSQVVADLLGDDLVGVRDLALALALADDDHRSVGEVVARLLRGADLVVAGGLEVGEPTDAKAITLLRHLTSAGTLRLQAPEEVAGADLVARRHDDAVSSRWEDPLHVEPSAVLDGDGVWTLDLRDWRPLHPERLMDQAEDLGSGRLVSRGRFWVPTRPRTLGVWDGAGGQLSVGDLGTWAGSPSTRIVVTGCDEDPWRVRRAFATALLTDAELAAGLRPWAGRSDGLDPWMGPRSDAA